MPTELAQWKARSIANSKRDLHWGASISAVWALSRDYSLLGDPGGVLETTDDMAGFADNPSRMIHGFRSLPVQVSCDVPA